MALFDRIPMPTAVCDVYGRVVLANPAMATEWGATPGRLCGRDVLELFRPREATPVERIAQALRLRHRSRYPVSGRWDAADGVRRHGELTADPISDDPDTTPSLLVLVRVLGEGTEAAERPAAPPASPTEARVLALPAGGATTARTARETGLTVDGVNYHLRRLSARWSATGRTELVARAYALGVLASGVWPPAPASTTKSIGPFPEV
ncbi:PAS domain S-box protein [Streptomyces ossamyceticus]|uniref:PAS domain S-box protein n=1 Tax=Streptomyces ossamyceticus TaxID=249581 RepID=UPI003423E586